MNIIDYVKKYQDKSFNDSPFNTVDAFLLSILSYINFDEVCPHIDSHLPSIKIKDIVVKDFELFTIGSVDNKRNEKLFKLIQNTQRFGDISLNYCQKYMDEKTENQFFAVTFFLPRDEMFISLRGTDTSITGWKEDLSLSFLPFIPSQKEALEYTKYVYSEEHKKFYVGGHSKGGNLAYYVASNLGDKLQDDLIQAYSFDGPGLNSNIHSSPSFKKLEKEHKLTKIITNRSIIGIIFNDIEKTKAVISTGTLLGGHDPFFWKINTKNGDFKYAKKRTSFSYKSEEVFNEWLSSISIEDKKLLCGFIFQVLEGYDSVYDLIHFVNVIQCERIVWSSYSDEDRLKIKNILKKIFKYYVSSI